MDGRLHNGKFTESAGGVGRNICEVLGKLEEPPHFLTTVGKDLVGNFLQTSVHPKSRKFIQEIEDGYSAQCAILLDKKGECKLLIGQMSINNNLSIKLASIKFQYVIKLLGIRYTFYVYSQIPRTQVTIKFN